MNRQADNDITPLELPELHLPQVDKSRKSNDDFMTDLVRVGNEVNKAIILVSGVIPQKKISLDKLDVLRGHLVRLYKLFDTYSFLIVERRSETAFIILRTLAETIINLRYLLKHIDTDVYKKYKRASVAYEKQLEASILKNILERDSELAIETRMLKSIKKTISRSKLADLEEMELKKTQWGVKQQDLEVSGKAKDVELYVIYENIFKTSSHFVHGSWHELDFYHLEQKKDNLGARLTKMHYTAPRPQLLESISIFTLQTLQEYLKVLIESGNQADEINDYLNKISKWFIEMSSKHEEFLSTI